MSPAMFTPLRTALRHEIERRQAEHEQWVSAAMRVGQHLLDCDATPRCGGAQRCPEGRERTHAEFLAWDALEAAREGRG